MGWLDDKWNDPDGKNAAKHHRIRIEEAGADNAAGAATGRDLREKAGRRIDAEFAAAQREIQRDNRQPLIRGRDILSGSVNAMLFGAIALAAVAITNPDSHDTIRSGLDTISESAGEIRRDLHDKTRWLRADPFAPAFDNE